MIGPRPRQVLREGGFTLVELLIVMVIVAILMALAVSSFSGSKGTAKRQEAIVAAHSLQKSVEGFRRDREGRVPFQYPADWPNIKPERGPVDADVQRPYMRALHPSSVRLVVRNSAGAGIYTYGAAALPLEVDYQPATGAMPTTYRITVREKGAAVCVLTNGPTVGSDKPC